MSGTFKACALWLLVFALGNAVIILSIKLTGSTSNSWDYFLGAAQGSFVAIMLAIMAWPRKAKERSEGQGAAA